MGYRKDRDNFIASMTREGVPVDVAVSILRDAATHQRISRLRAAVTGRATTASAKVKPCSRCEGGYAPTVLLKGGLCPSCRAENRIAAKLAPFRVTPDFGGDPRGCGQARRPWRSHR